MPLWQTHAHSTERRCHTYVPSLVRTRSQAADVGDAAVLHGRSYLLERGIVADLALVRAYEGDIEGNLRYRLAARYFNPVVATCAAVTVAQVEHVSDAFLDPDSVVTPGVFVRRLVWAMPREKHI